MDKKKKTALEFFHDLAKIMRSFISAGYSRIDILNVGFARLCSRTDLSDIEQASIDNNQNINS
jgi:hypothetical protein